MFLIIKKLIIYFIEKLGYKIFKRNHPKVIDSYQLENNILKKLLEGGGVDKKIIFDIGAHKGESIERFKTLFSKINIHSFEPSNTVFEKYLTKFKNDSNVFLNNIAISNKNGSREFFNYEYSNLSSFYKLNQFNALKKEIVKCKTIDKYTQNKNFNKIDLVKIDTQGNDINVLKGAQKTLEIVKVVLIELTHLDSYGNSTTFGDVENFMPNFVLYDITKKVKYSQKKGFQPKKKLFCNKKILDGYLSWCNAIYINKSFFN